MNTFSFVIFVTLPFWPVAASAQLNVLISGGFSGAYEQLLPEFERTSGIKVTTGSGASQGTGPQTIAAQLARGVPADVVILSRQGQNHRGPRKHERYLAYERSFSAARHRGKDQRQGRGTRQGRDRHGRRGRRGSCGHADQ